MSKSLVVVGYSSREVGVYCEQVAALFGDAIELRRRLVGELDLREEADADLILFSSYDAWERSGGHCAPPRSVVFADRTISRAGFDRLSALPEGAEAALYDESPEMAAQMVAALLQMGLRHLRLTPASPQNPAPCAGRPVIVLGEPGRAPEAARGIVDIGSALLSVGTIIDLGRRLELDHLLVQRNIRTDYRELVTDNIGLAAILDKINRHESSLHILLQVIDAGVVGVDAEGRIFTCNEEARRIAGAPQGELVGASWAEVFPQLPVARVLETRAPVRDFLVKIGDYDVVCSADLILNSGQLYGAVAVFKRFSEEERKQHRIRAQLVGKGYRARHVFEDIVAVSAPMLRCKAIARRMADSNSSILISGETGTGKEMLAQAIHNSSGRREYQFVAVNCGALPESLLESELFGYEEGAFTGARRGGKPGLFELAHRGTLFLDEIGEMPPSLQMRLLRVLEEREVMRLGSDRLIAVDIRVVAATNRDLKRMVAEGRFREDLFYRLSVLPLLVPPLRERPEDVLPLLKAFMHAYDCEFAMSPEAERRFLRHRFRGNARELRNYVEFIANLGIARVEVEDLPFEVEDRGSDASALPTSPTTVSTMRETGSSAAPPDGGQGGSRAEGRCAEIRAFALAELARAFRDGLRLGRRGLHEIARERRLFYSEQELRAALKDLEARALVEVRPGKGGTVISKLGLSSLESQKRIGERS